MMKPKVQNLNDYASEGGETFLPLVSGKAFRLESIVSRGQASPPELWYDQPRSEWIALLSGEATLEFKSGEVVEMRAGDYLQIDAHCRHRVAKTTKDTVWLALHFEGGD